MTLLVPNSTQVPNFLLDKVMPVVDSAEWKVISLICRKTFGWQKQEDRISLTQFEHATNLSRPWLVRILARLTRSGLLHKSCSSRGDIYSLNLDCDVTEVIAALQGHSEPVKPVNQSTQLTKTGSVALPKPVHSVNTQKPTETNKPKKIPSGVGRSAAADPRHRLICEHIRKRHAEANDMPLQLVPWDAAEDAVLEKFLKKTLALSVENACRCIDNYYRSDVNISARPRKWIPNLIEYWVGPVNQYGTPRLFEKEHQREMKRCAAANVGVFRGTTEPSQV